MLGTVGELNVVWCLLWIMFHYFHHTYLPTQYLVKASPPSPHFYSLHVFTIINTWNRTPESMHNETTSPQNWQFEYSNSITSDLYLLKYILWANQHIVKYSEIELQTNRKRGESAFFLSETNSAVITTRAATRIYQSHCRSFQISKENCTAAHKNASSENYSARDEHGCGCVCIAQLASSWSRGIRPNEYNTFTETIF